MSMAWTRGEAGQVGENIFASRIWRVEESLALTQDSNAEILPSFSHPNKVTH